MGYYENVNGTKQRGNEQMTIKQLIGFILFILLLLSIGFVEKPSDYHLPLEVSQNYNY